MAKVPRVCYGWQNKRFIPSPVPYSHSPLRYPGSKRCLTPLMQWILQQNHLAHRPYAEPFAGGSALALELLYKDHVSEIHLNDMDPAIGSFWYSILHHTDEFVDRIRQTPITMGEWTIQRQVHRESDVTDPLSLGFAAFFLNRTNRSGIIKAGVIGGKNQTGRYKLDCRFNREDLEQRVRRIAKYRDRIHVSCQDAIDFIARASQQLPGSTFFCVDPPYLNRGRELYTSFYTQRDHEVLAKSMLALDHPWVVTYDDSALISGLYRDRRQYRFDLNYSVQTKRRGTELMIVSRGLAVPPAIRKRPVNKPTYQFVTVGTLRDINQFRWANAPPGIDTIGNFGSAVKRQC